MKLNINSNLFLGRMNKYGGFLLIILGFFAICHRWYVIGEITISDMSDGGIPISLGIALFAIGISYESADRMKAIANTNFLQVVNMFEDVRVFFISDWYNVETFTWKSRSHIEMATELLKEDKKKYFIEKSYQDKLVKYFKTSMNVFFQKGYTWSNIKDSQRANIVRAYYLLHDFYREEATEEDLQNLLVKNFNEEERADFKGRVRRQMEKE